MHGVIALGSLWVIYKFRVWGLGLGELVPFRDIFRAPHGKSRVQSRRRGSSLIALLEQNGNGEVLCEKDTSRKIL